MWETTSYSKVAEIDLVECQTELNSSGQSITCIKGLLSFLHMQEQQEHR